MPNSNKFFLPKVIDPVSTAIVLTHTKVSFPMTIVLYHETLKSKYYSDSWWISIRHKLQVHHNKISQISTKPFTNSYPRIPFGSGTPEIGILFNLNRPQTFLASPPSVDASPNSGINCKTCSLWRNEDLGKDPHSCGQCSNSFHVPSFFPCTN